MDEDYIRLTMTIDDGPVTTMNSTNIVDLSDVLRMCQTMVDLGFNVVYGIYGKNVDITITKE